ncbi:MAG: Holliday junction-specific endonuclease [Firmicutes bacterium ADurb.Bin506]|nr:MAG: Holliday junction-specific endonuclease [Firmicutes bacterium ADurb.Bin506]
MARPQYSRQTPQRKDPVKQYQGAVSRAQGKHFEDYIDLALRYYEQRGEATIEKTPEPMRPTKDLGNGKFLAYYEKQAQPDYKGTRKGGKTVIFEAKYTSATQIDQSRVTREQAERFDKYHSMGAECFVVAGLGNGNCYRVPWEVWRDMKGRFGHKHATAEELEPYQLSIGRSGVLLLLD